MRPSPARPQIVDFSDRTIRRLATPQSGRLEVRDKSVPDLWLRVTSSGTKTFTVRGRIKGGPEVRATLGRWPNLAVDAARRLARERLNQWALGEDHREAERARAARKLPLEEVCRQYIKQHRHRLKPGYIKAIDQLLRGPLGSLARRPVIEINGETVLRWHEAQSSPSSADRAARVLRALLNFAAKRHGLRPADAQLGTDMLTAMHLWRGDVRRTTMIDDMPRWRAAVEGLPDDGVRDLLLTLAWTGMRRNEWRLATWQHIDLDKGTIHLPDPKNHKPVTLPLCSQVREILERRARLWGNAPDDFVFTKNNKPVGEFGLFQVTVSTAPSVCQQWCIHDLRRNFVTVADQLMPPAVARRLVHHAARAGDVHDGYFVLDVERLRPYAQEVANAIFKPAAEIIEFRRRPA